MLTNAFYSSIIFIVESHRDKTKDSRVVQSVERRTVNPYVVSSSLTAGANFIWPVGQVVKTPPFHGGIMGSNPVPVTIRALSSAGRASALQAECQRFDPVSAHHFFCLFLLIKQVNGLVVQLVRMPPCHGGGHGFESRPGRQYASVAQLVEQRTENPCVHSSILC